MNSAVGVAVAFTAMTLTVCAPSHAMGLRSFVALPVDKAGAVARLQLERNASADTTRTTVNIAYGVSVRQTVLLGLPYRLSPAGSDRLGDLDLVYRHTVRQQDFLGGTRRFALLGGMMVPTHSRGEPALQTGFVSTFFHGRHEWDFDALYRAGMNGRPDSGRYDLSWQYRVVPSRRLEWGVGAEWNSVIELGGRWTEGKGLVHQVTLGVQWIHARWVLEGGVFQDLDGSDTTRFLLSTRIHF